MDDFSSIFASCQLYPPASQSHLAVLEHSLGVSLPGEYARLLSFSNGLEGQISQDTSVQVWSTENVLSQNKTLQANKPLEGILIIGVTDGGEAICLDLRDNASSYENFFMVPVDMLDWDESEYLGSTINETFEKLKNPFGIPDKE